MIPNKNDLLSLAAGILQKTANGADPEREETLELASGAASLSIEHEKVSFKNDRLERMVDFLAETAAQAAQTAEEREPSYWRKLAKERAVVSFCKTLEAPFAPGEVMK